MLKDFINKLPLTTLFIAYLFFCGGLYTYSFWSSFKIDPSSLISVSEIPKNFIYPLIKSQGIALLILIVSIPYLNAFVQRRSNKREEKYLDSVKSLSVESEEYKKLQKKYENRPDYSSIAGVILFLGLLEICIYLEDWAQIRSLIISCFTMWICVKIIRSSTIIQYFPNPSIRVYLIISTMLPLQFSYTIGDQNSFDIIRNKDVQLIKFLPENTKFQRLDSLKLIGFLGTNVVVSTLDNKKITMVNQSSYERLEFTEYTDQKLKVLIRPRSEKFKVKIDTLEKMDSITH